MSKAKKETATTRTWKTYIIERRALDNRLNDLSANGAEIFAIYPALNSSGSYDVVTFKDE